MKKSKPIAILHLNLHREYFAKIVAGTKRIEYRDRSDYWSRRLEDREYDVVQFRNGYATRAPVMQVEFLGVRRTTRRGEPVYAIRLGRVLSMRRWKT